MPLRAAPKRLVAEQVESSFVTPALACPRPLCSTFGVAASPAVGWCRYWPQQRFCGLCGGTQGVSVGRLHQGGSREGLGQ